MKINYAVEIQTDYSGSISSIGLQNGVIRLITGTPGYDGLTPYPTWEKTTLINTNKYKEGILTNNFGTPNRRIDIQKGGDYGTVSGFTFEIENTMFFWNVLKTNNISIVNSNITLYTVINDVFYATWSGVVINDPYEELTTSIECESSYRKLHKDMPPNQMSSTLYPNIKKSNEGKPIPISFGDIAYAKLYNTSEQSERILLDNDYDGEPVYLVAMRGTIGNPGYSKYNFIKILTLNKKFVKDELKGYYIRIAAGDSNEKDKLIKIISNEVSIDSLLPGSSTRLYYTILVLDSWWDEDEAVINSKSFVWDNTKDSINDTWWFEIIDAKNIHILSNKIISEIKEENGQPLLYNWDSDREKFVNVSGLIVDKSVQNNKDVLELYRSPINIDNTITVTTINGCKENLMFRDISKNFVYGKPIYRRMENEANITDKNRSNYSYLFPPFNPATHVDNVIHIYGLPSDATEYKDIVFEFDISNYDMIDSQDIFAGVDLEISGLEYVLDEPANFCKIGVGFTLRAIDPYGKIVTLSSGNGIDSTYEKFFEDDLTFNFLPNDYYRYNGNDNGELSIFNLSDEFGKPVKDYLKFPSELVEMVKLRKVKKILLSLKFSVRYNYGAHFYITSLKIKEVGLFSYQTVKTGDNELYTRISGETVDGSETNSFAKTIKSILETYDGISTFDIDYNNLFTTRSKNNGWSIGRQITERKNSLDYLKDLCKFGFLGIHTKRDGKLSVKAFREDTDVVVAFNTSNIVKNENPKMSKTSLFDCYNQFTLRWGKNPATNEYNKSISIKNVDAVSSNFPDYYYDSNNTAPLILTNTVISCSYNKNGTGQIIFASSITSTLSVGDTITIHLKDENNIVLSEIVYYARVTFVNSNIVNFATPIQQTTTEPFETVTSVRIYKHTSDTPSWLNYVTGIKDYVLAKRFWDLCRVSYLKTKTIRNCEDLDCEWFVDDEVFYNSPDINYNSAPILFLDNLVKWTTLPKDIVTIDVPITADNMELELLDYVSYQDQLLTLNTIRYGWITNISVNINNSTMKIEITLLSHFYTDEENLIIETGSNDIEISESGSRTDIIQEGGS